MELFFHNEIEIDLQDPFKNDALGRKEQVEVLTSLIENANIKDMVLSIDAKWGEGKTTFIKMWERHLKNNGYKTIYYNAWENDYMDTPFISFAQNFETMTDDRPNKTKFIEASKKVAKTLLPAALKLATAGAIDLSNLKLGGDEEGIIASLIDKVTDQQISDMKESGKAIKAFKRELEKYIAKESPEKPVVFFIDELDRCKPTFALQLLEEIKHIFAAQGVIYVLSIDKSQLGNSLRAVYGTGIDVDGYLARFFDIEYLLPKIEPKKYIDYLYDKYNLQLYAANRNSQEFNLRQTLRFFNAIANIYNFSLRMTEKLINRLILIYNSTAQGYRLYEPLLSLLLCIKFGDSEAYDKLHISKLRMTELLSGIKNDVVDFIQNDTIGARAYGMLMAALHDENELKRIEDELKKWENGESTSQETTCLNEIKHTYDLYSSPFEADEHMLEYLLKKIDISDSFKLN